MMVNASSTPGVKSARMSLGAKLVIGHSGFLGMALLNALKESGSQVRGFDLNRYPDPESDSFVGYIRDLRQVAHACIGIDNFFNPYLQVPGCSVRACRIPFPLGYTLALVMEDLGRTGVDSQPPLLTHYVVLSTCRDFSFSSARARCDFGYDSMVSEAQAFNETLAWLKDQRWAA
jgi:hypothetical protein